MTRGIAVLLCALALAGFTPKETTDLTAACEAMFVAKGSSTMMRRMPASTLENRKAVCACFVEQISSSTDIAAAEKPKFLQVIRRAAGQPDAGAKVRLDRKAARTGQRYLATCAVKVAIPAAMTPEDKAATRTACIGQIQAHSARSSGVPPAVVANSGTICTCFTDGLAADVYLSAGQKRLIRPILEHDGKGERDKRRAVERQLGQRHVRIARRIYRQCQRPYLKADRQ